MTLVTLFSIPGISVTSVTSVTERHPMKYVKIPENLFFNLVCYHLFGNREAEDQIRRELSGKLDAMLRHDYYTQYKTNPDKTTREEARRKYIDSAGILPDFRW